MPAATAAAAQAGETPNRRVHVVYYIRFRDRIKIGTTKSLQMRLANLPHDELLAVEPGDRGVERARHQQFAESRIQGEWFEASRHLLQHTTHIREQHFALLAEAQR